MRVVLYAEGSTEDRGFAALPMQGETLSADTHGPAHILVARTIADLGGRQRDAIQFVTPLRLRGRHPRGSDLHVPKQVWQLLTFPDPTRRPELGIVLVDEDGQASRYRELTEDLRRRQFLLQYVIAVPVREFEAWLLPDQATLASVLRVTTTPPNPESMKPGEAKELLQRSISPHIVGADQISRAASLGSLRRSLAESVDLNRLATLRAYSRFRDDLRDSLRLIP